MRAAKPKRLDDSPLAEKREQILQGAIQVFLNHGYAGTSMDRVAAAAGVSKQTIYSHFQDKEGLFTALVERVTIHRLQRELGMQDLHGEPDVLLHQLATVFLHKLGNPEYLNLFRVLIAESARFPELAQLYSRTVIHRGRQMLSAYFRAHPELKITDPEAAAHIFSGSLVSFLLAQEILYGKQVSPLEGERVIKQLVALIVQRSDSS
ncbi:TetR/AcrR family transcriptional regulator [Leptolyngbya sp. NK1-12]|uniref:TetR/AcrR family transcriptional regulator n=1 Tax=Leptolyngbya sp. NK1-12 TaxID=2547451 RepID=UPI00292F3610|nr:TetR/AcrR family transcriptional regulator [Leptolyngbya sp. NK1-12]